MVSVGVIGGSGYTGKKIVQFCSRHPFVSEFKIYGNNTAGENLHTIFPDLFGEVENSVIGSVNDISYEHDLYFIALPHGEALKFVPAIIALGKKVIDLGGDYRLDSADVYEQWYKVKHTSSDLLNNKLYGLADWNGLDYTGTDLIANPGCYPTATLLGLLPLTSNISHEILSVSTVAYSGTSGAGKSAKVDMLMSEMDGNVRAYNVNGHRHQPEIEQMLVKNNFNAPFSFTTHLLPISVGIYATSSIHLKSKLPEAEVKNIYKNTYSGSDFIRLRDVPPNLTWVTGTNFCDINISVKDKTIIVTSAIDNLIKGAAGQAVQNMNKLYGWNEKLGILSDGGKNVSVY